MPAVKKYFSFTDKMQIWRLLISDTNKLVIETRDTEKKQAYFSSIDINKGKLLFKSFQLEEKFWLGIEDVSADLIYFHKFVKPDLPFHQGITAFSIESKRVLWENVNLAFLFSAGENLYAFRNKFEGKEFFRLNALTGEVEENMGEDAAALNQLQNQRQKDYSNYIFPESTPHASETVNELLKKEKETHPVIGSIYSALKENLLMINYHTPSKEGLLNNLFKIIEINTEKVIFEDVLNSKLKVFIPDSFFVKDNNLYLLKNKDMLMVYKIIN